MKAKSIFLLCLILFISSNSPAEMEIGILGQLSYSGQYNMEKPKGFGINISQSLSRRIRLQFQYDYVSQSKEYFATVATSFIPTEGQEISDYFHSKTWAHSYELVLLYRIIRLDLIDVEIGGGFNSAFFDADIVGQSSGYRFLGAESERLGLSIKAVARVQFSQKSPLILNVGSRLRIEHNTEQNSCDIYHFFKDLYFREIFLGLSYKFWPHSR